MFNGQLTVLNTSVQIIGDTAADNFLFNDRDN